MARKPGTHTSKIYAFKSRSLGKYVCARAWGYDGQQDHMVRIVELRDTPVLVAKSEKSARNLLSMIPDYLCEQAKQAEEHVYKARLELDYATRNGQSLGYHENRLRRKLDHLDEIMSLLNHPIDVVLVETTTETKETVV